MQIAAVYVERSKSVTCEISFQLGYYLQAADNKSSSLGFECDSMSEMAEKQLQYVGSQTNQNKINCTYSQKPMFLKKENMYKGVEVGDKYTQCHIIFGSQQHLHTRKQEYKSTLHLRATQTNRVTEDQRGKQRLCLCVDLCKGLVQNKTRNL